MSGETVSAHTPLRAGSTWRRVAGEFGRQRGMLGASTMLILLSVGLSAIGPLLLQGVINNALPRHQTTLLAELCLGIVATSVLAGLAGITQGMVASKIGQRVVHDLRMQVYDRIQRMDLNFFSGDANTEIQARLVSDIGGISDILALTLEGTLASGAMLITACVVMAILSWPLALISVVLAFGLNTLNRRFSAQRDTVAVRRQDRVARLMQLVGEDLSLPGVLLGRTLGRTDLQRRRFAECSEEISELTYRQRVANRRVMALVNMTFGVLPPMIYLLSGTIVHGISLGTAVVLATMQGRLTFPIQQLTSISGTMHNSKAMFQRVFGYLDLSGAAPFEPAALPLRPVSEVPALRAQGASYRYPNADWPALDEVRIEFPPCTFTVVTGRSGSGKSTLALLAAGLIPPTDGEVTLTYADGVPTRVRPGSVTLVSQDAAIFNASIRENLLFARPDATDEEITGALADASLGRYVSRLPDGLDTLVGERGYQLSGGERQRLALARALLAGSRVLIVDEATSALDGLAGQEVYRHLRSLARTRTVIMIAHRLPPLSADDRVLVLADGRVAEQGEHQSMLDRRGIYYSLVATQSAAGAEQSRGGKVEV